MGALCLSGHNQNLVTEIRRISPTPKGGQDQKKCISIIKSQKLGFNNMSLKVLLAAIKSKKYRPETDVCFLCQAGVEADPCFLPLPNAGEAARRVISSYSESWKREEFRKPEFTVFAVDLFVSCGWILLNTLGTVALHRMKPLTIFWSVVKIYQLPSIPGSGRFLGEGNDYPLLYSCLENSVDRGAWWAAAHGVANSWTRLNE